MARIELDDVGLRFPVVRASMTLKDFLLGRGRQRPEGPPHEIEALRAISFQLDDGCRLGVIGRNGAGKSTLLRVLAGIYPPTSGRLRVEGRINSLFELSLGFEPEATGWENIRLRGYLQGETPKTLRSRIAEIGEFSELRRFLDLPVRCYSSGMLVRLAFSIAVSMEPEILLVDEVLSAGDLAFQQKARRRIREVMARAQLLVIVSHDLSSLPELCNRCIWLDRGGICADGLPADVVAAYVSTLTQNQPQAA